MTAEYTIDDLIRLVATQLKKKYDNNELATQYAWWVVEAITRKKKSELIGQHQLSLTAAQQEQLKSWIDKQLHEDIPLAYLIGSVPFIDATIMVEPPILIPRPETENWVAELIGRLHSISNRKLTILDLCTGSGCIAIALARAFPDATIYAIDISQEALVLARKNATLNKVTSINFIQSDLFHALPQSLRFDLIVANPPYIDPAEWQTLDRSVKDWEDRTALIANENGLGILRKIIEQAPSYLRPHHELIVHHLPQLIVEIGYLQGSSVQRLFQENGFYDTVIEKDLQGNDRIVSGCLYHEAHD